MSALRSATRLVARLPIARPAQRQMSHAHGPPDAWPKTQEAVTKLHKQGAFLVSVFAFIAYKIRSSGSEPVAAAAAPVAAAH